MKTILGSARWAILTGLVVGGLLSWPVRAMGASATASDIGMDSKAGLGSSNVVLAAATPPPLAGSTLGLWISPDEIQRLPTSGAAWDRMRTTAYASWGTADLKNQDNKHGIYTLAGALVYARTGDASLRGKVRDAIIAAKRTLDESAEWGTTNGVLAAGRQLGAYVISADLIDLKNYDASADTEFRSWLTQIRTTNIGTHGRWKSITYCCENAAANWAAFACASRIAASIYLGDKADVERSAAIIRALFGERAYYPADAPGEGGYFQHTADYQSSWACDEATWTGINPACTKSGVNIDGTIVEDASRGGGCCTLQGSGISYSWESLQGYFVSAELLYRTGSYGNPYSWSNQALKRAMDFVQRAGWVITNPASYVPWMANARYGTNYPATASAGGRIMSWGDWLYAGQDPAPTAGPSPVVTPTATRTSPSPSPTVTRTSSPPSPTATRTGSPPSPTATPVFDDVPSSHWAYSYITALAQDGFISGCSTNPPRYCPEAMTNRAEMAVFVERGDHGAGFVPAEPTQQVFADVALSTWYAKWVTALWQDAYTAGCGTNPLMYCPEAGHTRAEAAVFFVRLRLGKDYQPPAATTTGYDDVPVGANQPWYSKWIAAAEREGIVQACEDDANRGDRRYRPTEGLTRAEGACMLYLAKRVTEPTPAPPPPGQGIWISQQEIESLPTSGAAWDKMRTAAYGSWGTPDLKNQDNKFGIQVLAGAFVYARTGDGTLRAKVRDGIISAKRTMDEASEWQTVNGALSLGRQLGAFVISADLIDLKSYDTAADTEFRNYLRTIRTTNVGTHGRWKSIAFTCENAAANWGTFACPSRLAASIYLGDTADVQRVANIVRAWMGERSYYPADGLGQNGYFQPTAGWDRSVTWTCNASTWTAVSPACTKSGVNLDGVLVEDASRGGTCCTIVGDGIMYSWEVLQGAFVSAEILYRTGDYGNPYAWSNNALKRAMDFMQRNGWGITNPASYVPWMANARYNTNYPTGVSQPGRIMSWGDWLYQR